MRVLLTGHRAFLDRFFRLGTALEAAGFDVTRLEAGNLNVWLPVRLYNFVTRGTRLHDRLFGRDPNPAAFRRRSLLAASAVRKAAPAPDIVLHIFSTFAPAWVRTRVPYAMYVDFTMAQALREYPAWSAFASTAAREAWLRYERRAYESASHIFTMGEATASAVTTEYGVPAARVSVVGCGSPAVDIHDGPKSLAGARLLVDLSDFHRKGGDIVLAAFDRLRRTRPALRMTTIGGRLDRPHDGVDDLGHVSDPRELERLFLSADLVLSAARCDPYPGFLIEAMSCGVPVVLASRVGLASPIAERGAGVVVPGGAPDDFARAIDELLDDRARWTSMSAAARDLARTSLNWRVVAAQMAPRLAACVATAAAPRSSRATRPS